MDIKELDKKQLILLVLLITFVVSIATGIVTVSLMKQMPASVPQAINNVIERTIEKVTTIEVPATDTGKDSNDNSNNSVSNSIVTLGDSNALVSIYLNNKIETTENPEQISESSAIEPIGQGIIISEVGLILIDSSLVNETDKYKVILNKTDFSVEVLKKFNNGFTILKISPIESNTETTENTENTNTTIQTQ